MKFEENINNTKDDKPENEYDQEVPENKVGNLQKDIEEKIRIKAEELGISKEELIDLAGLDLESLEAEKLKELNLRRGEFDFIKEGVDQAINEFQKSEKPNTVLKDAPSVIDKIRKFAEKHKKVVSIGQLTLYLSSYGVPVLNALADNDVKVEIYGEKISLKDLAENPELIKTIDRRHNYASPIDILAAYSPPESFKYDITTFSFTHQDKVIDENNVERLIYFSSIGGDLENLKKLESDLEDIGISFKYEKKCTLNDFFENKDEIIDIFSEDLEIPREKVEKYIESLIMPDISNVSVVEFEDFKINKNLEISEDAMKLQQIKEEVYKRHSVNSEDGIRNPENWLKAEKELEQWGKENGYESFDKALYKEIEENNNNPVNRLEILKFQENIEHENSEDFKKNVLDVFEKEGYDISTLKEIAEDNPEEVIKIISKVMGKNIKYDYIEANLDLISKDLRDIYQGIKHSQGIPYITLESGKGVCHDYGITFVAVKNVLEEEGVPNIENFVSLYTTADKQNHLWNVFVATDPDNPDKIIVSYGDPTWDDSPLGEFNAVDKKHYYTSLPEKLDEAHQKALEKIRDWNNLVKQEKLKEILMQYDPKLHKRGRKIEGNKKLREVNKDIEISLE